MSRQPCLVELNALTSKSGATQAEAFGSLINTGSNQIAKRERIINALISDVETNSASSGFLHGVTVNGVSLSHSLIALLDGVDGQLQAIASHIAGDTLVDQLRADIVSIGASTRVYGLIEPMVHLVLAGGAELNLLNILSTQAGIVHTKIGQRPSGSQAVLQATTNPRGPLQPDRESQCGCKAVCCRRAGFACEWVPGQSGHAQAGARGSRATQVAARQPDHRSRRPEPALHDPWHR